MDELGGHAAHRLYTERKRSDVEQQHIAVASDEILGLQRGAERHDLVRIQLAVRFPAEEPSHQTTHQRDARGPTDQDDLIDVRRLHSGIVQRLLAAAQRAIDERPNQLLELRTGDPPVGAKPVALHDDSSFLVLREIPLRADHGLTNGLNLLRRRRLAAPRGSLAEIRQRPLRQQLVDIIPSEMGVAIGRKDLEDPVLDAQDGHVECAPAEVVDGDYTQAPLVEPVGQRCGGRLVDDPQHFQSGQAGGVAGRGALGVVEVRGHRNDGAEFLEREIPIVGEERLGAISQSSQDECRDLRGRELVQISAQANFQDAARLAADPERKQPGLVADIIDALSHEPLHGIHGSRGVDQEPALGVAAEENRSTFGKGHNRGHQNLAHAIGDHEGFAVLDVGDEAIGRTEVDADGFFHGCGRFSTKSTRRNVTRDVVHGTTNNF